MKTVVTALFAALAVPNPAVPPPPPAPLQPTVPLVAVNTCDYAVDFYLVTVDAKQEDQYSPWFTFPPRQSSRVLAVAGQPLVHNPEFPLRMHRRPLALTPQVRRTNAAPIPEDVPPGQGQHPLVEVPFKPDDAPILVDLCGDYEEVK